MMEEREDFDVLLGKFFAGEANPDEAILVEDWKTLSNENMLQYKKLEKFYFGLQSDVDENEAWLKIKDKTNAKTAKVKRMVFSWQRLAAMVTLILAISFFSIYWLNTGIHKKEFFAENSKQQIKLEDGTKVNLDKNSSLLLDEDFNGSNRKIKLVGSAYFTVKHDDKKQFIIDAGAIQIKDLGTKFDVKTVKDTIFIRVDEGSVLIYNEKGLKITLEANEQAYYVISQGSLKITVENDFYEKRAPIKLIFENQSLKRVVESLNQMYSADIRLNSSNLENCRITTQFIDEKIEVVLEIIAETLNLEYEFKDGYYLLIGKGC